MKPALAAASFMANTAGALTGPNPKAPAFRRLVAKACRPMLPPIGTTGGALTADGKTAFPTDETAWLAPSDATPNEARSDRPSARVRMRLTESAEIGALAPKDFL